MKAYLEIVKKVFAEGVKKNNRTGIDAIAIPGVMFEHDMAEGFPLLTTKRVPFPLVASELEFFIGGFTDKKWLQKRNNHIWDEWCSPDKVRYDHDDETKKRMLEERDLGPIYGFQWRNFGARYVSYNTPPATEGVDQLKKVIHTLKTNPTDRRMLVSAWNPMHLKQMALPPCHYGFQIIVVAGKLSVLWNQRSVDTALGLPFNIASYGLLLHLLAKESGLKEGKLIGFLGDTHIYLNHVDGLKKQLKNKPFDLPALTTHHFTSIFDWKHSDTEIINYKHHAHIKFDIAI
ncbi:MAG: thymidylate synthase [Deltaproteobacteria bacterium]|nr:MAG: thymidylate synthase [Deltaproteobacteria bacterium]